MIVLKFGGDTTVIETAYMTATNVAGGMTVIGMESLIGGSGVGPTGMVTGTDITEMGTMIGLGVIVVTKS
jgi:hypothetical protein